MYKLSDNLILNLLHQLSTIMLAFIEKFLFPIRKLNLSSLSVTIHHVMLLIIVWSELAIDLSKHRVALNGLVNSVLKKKSSFPWLFKGKCNITNLRSFFLLMFFSWLQQILFSIIIIIVWKFLIGDVVLILLQ